MHPNSQPAIGINPTPETQINPPVKTSSSLYASCSTAPGVGGTGTSPVIKLCSSHGFNVLRLRLATLSARLRTSRLRLPLPLPSFTGDFSSPFLGVAAADGAAPSRRFAGDGTIVSLPSVSLAVSRALCEEDAAEEELLLGSLVVEVVVFLLLRILTPPAVPFSSIDTLPLVVLLKTVEPDTSLLATLELVPTVEVDEVALLPLPLPPIFAAFNFARTRAALASRSEAANFAAMRATVTGDCCEVGRRCGGALRGRRELDLGGERQGDSGGGGWERLVDDVGG